MPIATLEYDLSDEDDRIEYAQAQQGSRALSVLWELDQWLRQLHKYGAQSLKVGMPEDGEPTLSKTEIVEVIKEECAYLIRERLHELLNENDVSLEP